MPNETREAITARVTEIATRAAAPEGIEIVETQLLGSGNQRVLRIFIDKPSGVTHADCEYMSVQVGTVLDMEDVIPDGRYTLEVSSPGLERPLRSAADFSRFAGQKAKIVLRQPVDGKTVWIGVIGGCSDGRISVDEGEGKTVTLPLDQVRKAHLKFDW
jgi:ribosome maturation factor RimP